MAAKQFELVFSLYSHPSFGVLIEPFLVQLLENGNRSLSFQKVAEANVDDFYPQVSSHEKKLIGILQRLSNQQLAKDFKVLPVHLETQIQKLSDAKDLKSKHLLEHVKGRLSIAKEEFFAALDGTERLFETGKDGYPAGQPLKYRLSTTLKLEYLFTETGLEVRPVFSDSSLKGLPVQVLDENTSVILVGQHLLRLPEGLKPARLRPFGAKRFIEVQQKFAAEYARKILIPDLRAGLAELKGDFTLEKIPLSYADLYFSFEFEGSQLGIFENRTTDFKLPTFLTAELGWYYGSWKADALSQKTTWIFEDKEKPVFQVLERDLEKEKAVQTQLEKTLQIAFVNGTCKLTFAELRDQILEKLSNIAPEIRVRFSPEFNQLSLKKSRFNIKIFEKIDYFHIEGTIDWDGEEMDLLKLRTLYQMQQGWLRIGDRFLPLDQDDQLFLSQLMVMSSGSKELAISKTTALAIQENSSGLFAESWNKITALLASRKKEKFPDVASLSPNFQLRDYQIKGVEWFIHLSVNRLGGILADDMGLGKTFQAAAFLRFLHKTQPGSQGCTLIIVPSTLIFNWQHELKRFSDDFRVYVHSGPNRSQDLKSSFRFFNVILVSFQTLVRDVKQFAGMNFNAIIVDEAHNLKNPSTVAYKAVKSLTAENVFLLTGTPLQNSPADLWALSELCNPGLLSQKIKPASLQRNENQVRFQENLLLMQALVKPFLLRRTKQNVLTELPEKSVSVLHCTMTDEQELEYLAYNQLVSSEMSDLAFGNPGARSVRILKALTSLRLLANHPVLVDDSFASSSGKFDLVKEKLEEVLQEGHKVLIFSSFVKHLDIIATYLRDQKVPFSMLTGKTGNRKEQVDLFKEEADRNVFLISLKAGGVGLNLVEASYVFLLDPWWNPAAEAQAMDRVYRIGQKNRVTVYKFITSNSVEEKILKLQEQKNSMNDQLFESGEMDQRSLTLEALQEILVSKL
jgi:SNF2 family DNA or RNA helicase